MILAKEEFFESKMFKTTIEKILSKGDRIYALKVTMLTWIHKNIFIIKCKIHWEYAHLFYVSAEEYFFYNCVTFQDVFDTC